MKLVITSGLSHYLLMLSILGGLTACSTVLQATRMHRLLPINQTEGIPADQSADEQAVMTNYDPHEYTLKPVTPLSIGYHWVFIRRDNAKNGSLGGYWAIKPIGVDNEPTNSF